MNTKLKVHFDPPNNGWIGISLETLEKKLELSISYTPFHFLDELVESLLKTLDGENSVARGQYNPEQYNFVFKVENDVCKLSIQILPNFSKSQVYGKEIFLYGNTVENVCLAFWRAIRELQGHVPINEYNEKFQRKFPERSFEFLTEKIKRLKLEFNEDKLN